MKHSKILCSIGLLLSLGVPAAAEKPIIEAAPFTSVLVPAADGCGFDLLLTPQVGRPNGERTITFANTQLILGPLFVTMTNLTSNEKIDVNISGPGEFTFSTLTIVNHGPTFGFGFPPSSDLPKVALFNGRVVFTLDPVLFNITSITTVGRVQDVCQMFD